MNKIELDKKKVKTLVKKSIPLIVGGTVAIVGGIIIYKRGYRKGFNNGINNGINYAICNITDHLVKENAFCIYNNSKNIPVIMSGVGVTSTEDIEKAVKMLDVVAPIEGEEAFKTTVKDITNIIFSNKQPIKTFNF